MGPEDADKIIARLQSIKEKYGEKAYKDACRDIARQALHLPQSDTILRKFFPEFDPAELKAEIKEGKGPSVRIPDTPAMPSFMPGSDEMMLQMLKTQVPNLKSQGQFNVFMACFDALRSTLNGYFGGEMASAEMAREALNQALDMGKKLAEVTAKLDEIPDEVKSETAKDLNRPAKELHEYDEARVLVVELEQIQNSEALQQWYDANRSRLDRIVTASLRNEVFDAIRAKRNALGAN
jgi:hypothetical protein